MSTGLKLIASSAPGVGRRLQVPRTNVTPNRDEARDYRSYYSTGTKVLVADWYAPEIALLGYGF